MWGVKRPHLDTFLVFCFSYFKNVCVWSAGQKEYVYAMVNYFARDIRQPHITFNYDHCTHNGNILEKPLSEIIKRSSTMNITNTFALDDRRTTFESKNPDNGILIPVYSPPVTIEGLQMEDDSLLQLIYWFLQPEVVHSKDIRTLD